MKNIFKNLAVVAMGIAMIGFVSCKKETVVTYAIHHNGSEVVDGQTLTYTASGDEIRNDFASVDMLLENKTDGNLETCIKIEKVEGPSALNDIMICYGETCKTGSCPWMSDPFTLVPGINQDMLVKFEYSPSQVTEKTTYRFIVGKGKSMDNPHEILININ